LWHNDVVTGLEEETSLRPYPNPVRGGVININTPVSQIHVADVLGRELAFTAIEHSGGTEIRLEDDFRGIVVLKVTSSEGSSVFKILVQ